MAFLDDFGIDYQNKRIYHVSGTTVYDVNAMYSALMDTFDELVRLIANKTHSTARLGSSILDLGLCFSLPDWLAIWLRI